MTVRATFDGKVLIPEQPLDLPSGSVVELEVRSPAEDGESLLADLLKLAESSPPNPDLPTDGAAQHDHYLYGTPKRK